MKFTSSLHQRQKLRISGILSLICLLISFYAVDSYGEDGVPLVYETSTKNKRFFLPLNLEGVFPEDMTSKKAAKRMMPIKPAHTKVQEGIHHKDSVIVKFAEGTGIRLRKGQLVSLKPTDRVKTRRQMLMLKRILSRYKVKKIERLFSSPERELDWMKDKEVRYV